MTLRIRASALLWGAFLALGGAAAVVRVRHPASGALPWLTACLLGLLALRVGTLLLDWRQGRLPITRTLLPGILLVEGLGLVGVGGSRVGMAVRMATAALLELLLLGLAFRALRRSQSPRATWPEGRIAAAFEAFVPPRAARLMALELVMLGSAVGFLAGGFRKPAPAGFSLHKEAFLRAFLPVLPLLIPTDLFLIHALFPHMAPWLRWFLHLSTVYAVLWLVGLYATLRQRPHQIGETMVELHMGLLGSLRLPRAQILSAAPLREFDDDGARRAHMRGMHRLLRTGVPAVELRLAEPLAMNGLLGRTPRRSDRVAVSVDDPSVFLAALGCPCA